MKEQDEERVDETGQAQRRALGVDFQKVETQGVGAVWISAGSEHSAAVLGTRIFNMFDHGCFICIFALQHDSPYLTIEIGSHDRYC